MSDLIITNLDFFIRELKRRHLLEEESAHLIHNNFDKNILVTVDNEFGQLPAKESGCVISDSVRQFLLTLYFHSPEAYNFFLKVSAVPRFSFVRAQLTNTQFHPGFFTELIENTNAKDVSLVIDRMSLRRHPVSLDEELVGFCDCGGVLAEDPNEMASEVVVFLLVTWEQVPQRFPIGYFLVHNLSAQVQAQLIESAIILADKNSLTVRNVVCDGSISNFSSLRLLGCQFDTANVVAHFKSAHGLKQLVYVTFDVNHLMTLAHNALADLGTFVTRKGEKISWEYLVHLLTMGSELWSNASSDPPLMSALATANLAAHVFSSSVADALLELRYSCTPGFEECLPTAQFIHQFHEVFTILNCKSQFGQGLQSPVDPTNVLDMRATINKFTSFLLGLKTEAGIPLHKSARRTFICGLLSTCQSVLKLSDLILQMSPQVYTSSFSLEHSEYFFEKICRKDDPLSAAAFKTSIKQFLNQQLVELSTPAAALDCCTSVSVVKPKWSRRCTTILSNEEKEGALDYLMGGQPLSDDELLTVAGGIVTALSGRVSCDSCCLALVDSGCVLDSLHYARGMSCVQQALARLKRGEGQIIPSQEVFRIVQRCERVFCHTALAHPSRYASHSKLALFLSASYRRSVLEDRPLSTFTHVCVLQKGSLSHQYQLSNYIVDKFFSIRLKRFTKLHCFRMLLGPH